MVKLAHDNNKFTSITVIYVRQKKEEVDRWATSGGGGGGICLAIDPFLENHGAICPCNQPQVCEIPDGVSEHLALMYRTTPGVMVRVLRTAKKY